jgi:hypothetical protein
MQFMALIRAVLLAVIFGADAVLIEASNPMVSIARAADTPGVSEADMTYFYKNPSPEEVARLMAFFESVSDKPSARPPMIGFLAAVFQRYPSDIDKMIPKGLSPQTLGVVAISLRLAGQSTRAQSIVDRLRRSGGAVPDLRRIPSSLEMVTATGPSEFDMFWGASFATGDPHYCLKILERFAAVANIDGNAEDMLVIAGSYGTGADLHWIVDKRGADEARELINVSTALWALNSNAHQHDFVRVAVASYIRAHPSEPASKALVSLAQRQ